MEQIYLSLLSGIFGSIFGAWITLYIYKKNKKDEAINNMLCLVHSIGFQSYYSINIGNAGLIFHEQYSELWVAYSALNKSIPRCKRNETQKAWREFMCMKGLFNDSQPDYWDHFKKGTHTSKEQAVKCCSEFITYLEKLH
jgi:hypothetical protein